MDNWIRIPIDISGENDRRTVLSILSDYGLEVRTKREKVKTRYQRYVEYREQGSNDCDITATRQEDK